MSLRVSRTCAGYCSIPRDSSAACAKVSAAGAGASIRTGPFGCSTVPDAGWVPAPTLAGRDDPNHKQMRAMFNEAFRPEENQGDGPVRGEDRLQAHRCLHRRRPLRLGEAVRRAPAPDHHRPADGRARRGHLEDQGLDRCLGAAPRHDADRGRGKVVGGDGDRGTALLPADLRAPAPGTRRHPDLGTGQPRHPGMGTFP